MIATADLIVVESTHQPAGDCIVCGNPIGAGEGRTARYNGMTLRFKCPGCVDRFRAEPGRYLAGHPAGCCTGERADASPASEWACDRS